MKLRTGTITCLLGVVCGTAVAQSSKDGERALRAAVTDHPLYLRGFSEEHEVRWRWDGSALVEEPPAVHALGVFLADSVKVKGDWVEIRGRRHAFLENKESTPVLSRFPDDVTITVDLAGADVISLLPRLPDLLFYPDLPSAIADLPEQYRTRLPAKVDAPPRRMQFAPRQSCDCTTKCGEPVPATGRIGMTPPKVTHQVDPEFSDEARRKKFNGTVEVGLEVDTSGRPENLWIIRAAGMGLDEKAAAAVGQYEFEPATCHGQPVPVHLYIDVSFRIF